MGASLHGGALIMQGCSLLVMCLRPSCSWGVGEEGEKAGKGEEGGVGGGAEVS